MAGPVGGVDYPRTWAEFVAWFPDDAACVAYLDRLRWGDGFVCPGCGSTRSWPASRGLGSRVCAGCAKRTSVTAGTVFAGTRTPLTQWFAAAWHVCSTKNGASALGLQKLLGLGSYETAWAWLHKLRRAMVIPGRDLLTGDVEVDETFVGGDEPGLRGGRARGKKALVAIAVECRGGGSGRTRLARDPRRRPPLAARVHHHPHRTRDDRAHRRLAPLQDHRPARLRAQADVDPRLHRDASELLPRVHRVAALLKRWLTAPTKAAFNPSSSTTTSTSSPSASTGASRRRGGCCSTASSTRPSAPNPTPTPPSSPASRSAPPCRPPPANADTRCSRHCNEGDSPLGALPTGSNFVTPSRHACRTRAVWRCRPDPALSGLLPPSPASPGSGAPSFKDLLRQANGGVLSPPPGTRRLVAHPNDRDRRTPSRTVSCGHIVSLSRRGSPTRP